MVSWYTRVPSRNLLKLGILHRERNTVKEEAISVREMEVLPMKLSSINFFYRQEIKALQSVNLLAEFRMPLRIDNKLDTQYLTHEISDLWTSSRNRGKELVLELLHLRIVVQKEPQLRRFGT